MGESQKYQAAFLLPQRQKVSQSWRQERGPCVKAACAGLLPPSSWEFSALIWPWCEFLRCLWRGGRRGYSFWGNLIPPFLKGTDTKGNSKIAALNTHNFVPPFLKRKQLEKKSCILSKRQLRFVVEACCCRPLTLASLTFHWPQGGRSGISLKF